LRFFTGTNKFETVSLSLTGLGPSNKWKFSGFINDGVVKNEDLWSAVFGREEKCWDIGRIMGWGLENRWRELRHWKRK
jgi:hypothetical protein